MQRLETGDFASQAKALSSYKADWFRPYYATFSVATMKASQQHD